MISYLDVLKPPLRTKWLRLVGSWLCALSLQVPSQSQSILDTKYYQQTYYNDLLGPFKHQATDILMDSHGFLWVGTEDCRLLRFDGVEFEEFTTGPQEVQRIGSQTYVFSLCEDIEGNIWGLSSDFILRLDRRTENIEVVPFEEAFQAFQIATDRDQSLWFSRSGEMGRVRFPIPGRLDSTAVKYHVPQSDYPPEFYQWIRDLETHKIAGWTGVGNDQELATYFELQQPTELIVFMIGEMNQFQDFDFGWLLNGKNETVWKASFRDSHTAGGNHRSARLVFDTLKLSPGKYSLNYRTSHEYSYTGWLDPRSEPEAPDLYGIQLFQSTGEIEQQAKQWLSDSAHLKHLSVAMPKPSFAIESDSAGQVWIAAENGLFANISKSTGDLKFERISWKQYPNYSVTSLTNGPKGRMLVSGIIEEENGSVRDFVGWFDTGSRTFLDITLGDIPLTNYQMRYVNTTEDIWLFNTIGDGPKKSRSPFLDKWQTIEFEESAFNKHLGFAGFVYNIEDMDSDPMGGMWVLEAVHGLRRVYSTNYGVGFFPIDFGGERFRYAGGELTLGVQTFAESPDSSILIGSEKNGAWRLDAQDQIVRPLAKGIFPGQDHVEIFQSSYGDVWFTSGRLLGKLASSGQLQTSSILPSDFFEYLGHLRIIGEWNEKLWLSLSYDHFASGRVILLSFDPKFNFFNTRGSVELALSNTASESNVIDSLGNFRHFFFDPEDGQLTLTTIPFDSLHSRTTLHETVDWAIRLGSGFTWVNDWRIDSGQTLWIASPEGLHQHKIPTAASTIYGIEQGLPSSNILSVLPTAQGDIVLGTEEGVSILDHQSNTFHTPPALQHLHYIHTLYENSQGYIFAASAMPPAVYIFHPDSLATNRIAPRALITQFYLDEDPVAISDTSVLKQSLLFTDELSLTYQQNNIAFEYRGMHFEKPEENQYAYQLSPVHKDWVMADKVKIARFADLSPGDYTFSVKSSNSHGLWGDPTELAFTIHPPWYWSAMAKTTYLLLLFGLLYTIYRWRVQSIRAENLKLEALVHERTLQLEEQAEQLKELDQAKTRFFANISHEFRTPLTLILGPLKKMYQGNFSGDPKSIYGVMIRNAQRLLRLINQLLDISKLEAGKMELKAAKGDLVHFVQLITANYTSLAASKQIKYQFYHRQDTLEAWFDPDKIEKIITNLLSNAFKFTPNGGEVSVYLGQQDDHAEIEVKDTGIGIPPEDLDKIFDRFHQVDATHTREQEGTGIGMTLVKELVELHQGTITVKSEVDKGTTFTILLPLGKEHLLPGEIVEEAPELALELEDPEVMEALQTAAKEDAALEESDHPHILIAEDNPDMRTYIREALEGQFNLSEAQDGQEGWEKAQESQPDLIISDVMMPRMDGIELCEKLKTHELTSHIPVILLTAKADRSSRLQGLETGADDYLAKPFDEEELLVLISNRIEQRRRMRERFKSNIHIGPKEVSVTSADQQFLEKAMAIVEENMSNDAFSVDDLAQEVGMSNRQLQRKFNALVDQSPNQFIRTMRLRRAAQLLTANSDSVSQIAYQVGFSSLSYFNKAFKEEFDMTPGEYGEKGDSISR